ncbi:recombinase RecT [Lysinibacillus capsici]|uniref:recombinase RecT n=1 Tax=Lysinibacillus capsici TaxID=2115968 RepID=UPI0027321327|nr:recombinase RecT [Lysinibacillus capsici]MDP1391988.1 recombinase RecT [Lysinibacillus capsici]MDP1412464.1 recombinase RecT [Lysinibacillus capsici]MDP1428904.1 recombinase RecT [Lysinibacillus capsici]
MATTNELKAKSQNQVSKQVTPESSLNALLKKMGPEIQRALPKHMDSDRIARIALTAVRTTPKLLECDQISFVAALMQAAQLGVEPNTGLGQAYLIPYGKQVQFQLGYKGLIDLAVRSGQYKAIYAHEVYQEDEFSYSYGLHKDLVHVPSQNPEGEPIGYYAVYHLKNGGYDFVYWTRERIEKHAHKFSQAVQKGWTSPWKTNYDAMAKKTVLKEVLKFAPKSIELQKVVEADETIKTEVSKDMSEVIDVTDYSVVEEEPVQEEMIIEQ